MSERATLWVRPLGRDVTLTLTGESPLRYFDRPSRVTISVAGREVGRFALSADFTHTAILPAGALEASAGQVIVESDQSFVPAERDGVLDRRRLALRIYSFDVR
jgi:hypothetical protein